MIDVVIQGTKGGKGKLLTSVWSLTQAIGSELRGKGTPTQSKKDDKEEQK
jgi:hypothetical protein